MSEKSDVSIQLEINESAVRRLQPDDRCRERLDDLCQRLSRVELVEKLSADGQLREKFGVSPTQCGPVAQPYLEVADQSIHESSSTSRGSGDADPGSSVEAGRDGGDPSTLPRRNGGAA